jgi:flagellar biosynthetic protein FliR
MFDELMPLFPLVVPFLLVLFRLLGLFAFVPFFSNSAIPGNVKVLLGLAISVCVWNVAPHVRESGAMIPETLIGLTLAVLGELAIGLLIGLMVGALFGGIQLGAHMVSQQMGLSMATLYDPAFEDQSTVIEQIAFWITLVAFLAMGGHRQLINAVVYSYQKVPIGSAAVGGGLSADVMLNTLIASVDTSFHAAAQIAMPALVAFFIATVTVGLMSRSMPQLNLMTVGIAVYLIVGFFMVAAGLTAWAAVSQQNLREMMALIARIFGG